MRGHSAAAAPPKARAARTSWGLAGALALALTGSGCAKGACDSVAGSCLALHVDGLGSYDRLEGVLLVSPTGATLKSGDAATQVTLPVTIQILPPDFSTATAGALRVNGYRGPQLAASGLVTLSWPEGARIDVKLALIEVVSGDMAPGDMAPADLAQ